MAESAMQSLIPLGLPLRTTKTTVCKPVSVACEPSLWPGPSPRTGKRISDARDEGPRSASGRSSFPAETANGPSHPPQPRKIEGVPRRRGTRG